MAKKKYKASDHIINPEGQIYLGIPRERIYIPKFVDNRDSILANIHGAGRGKAGYFQAEGHRVDRNRDRISFEFMRHKMKPEWLLMIDSDMEHPVDIGIRLTAWAKPIVGGLYFHRGDSHDPFAFKKSIIDRGSDIFGRERQQWLPMRDEVYEFLQENRVPLHDGSVIIGDPATIGLTDCDAVATGAMLIHRSVLEHMDRPWFEYRAGGHSEDLVFCDEAKFDYGIPILCDFSTMSGHYAWQPMGQAQFQTMYLGRGINLSLYTLSEMARLFGSYFDLKEELAREELKQGNAHMVGSYWKSKNPKKVDEVREFYADPHTGYLYVKELIHWNASEVFDHFKKELMFARGLEVLEIGAGIGSMSIQLAVQKCNIVASEINDVIRGFAEHRWNDLLAQLNSEMGKITFVKNEWKSIPDNSLDLVVAFDVLEHMPADDVQEFLALVGKALKPGTGQFAYHNNWKQQDIYPMHFDYEKQWLGWLDRAGLKEVSPIKAIRKESIKTPVKGKVN